MWRELRYHCTGKWGLSRHTLTVMYKTLILLALLYCTPVWASQNITKLTKFQHTITCSIMETRYNANSAAAEVLLGIPPINILCQNISSKFFTKVLPSNDHMTNQIIENESDLAFLMGHRNTLRQFKPRQKDIKPTRQAKLR